MSQSRSRKRHISRKSYLSSNSFDENYENVQNSNILQNSSASAKLPKYSEFLIVSTPTHLTFDKNIDQLEIKRLPNPFYNNLIENNPLYNNSTSTSNNSTSIPKKFQNTLKINENNENQIYESFPNNISTTNTPITNTNYSKKSYSNDNDYNFSSTNSSNFQRTFDEIPPFDNIYQMPGNYPHLSQNSRNFTENPNVETENFSSNIDYQIKLPRIVQNYNEPDNNIESSNEQAYYKDESF